MSDILRKTIAAKVAKVAAASRSVPCFSEA